MATILDASGIPQENLFLVGVVEGRTSRDWIVIRRPRRPFVVSRAEALNIIGYVITHADFTVQEVEDVISTFVPEQCPFTLSASDKQAYIDLVPHPAAPPTDRFRWSMYLLTLEEAKFLLAALVHAMTLHPREIDAAVMAVFYHARNLDGTGQALEDMLKS